MFRILATVDWVLCLLIAPYVAHNAISVDICNGGDGKHEDSDESDGEKDSSAKGDTGKGEWDKSNFDKDGVKNVKKGIVTAAESFQACFVDNPPLLLRT